MPLRSPTTMPRSAARPRGARTRVLDPARPPGLRRARPTATRGRAARARRRGGRRGARSARGGHRRRGGPASRGRAGRAGERTSPVTAIRWPGDRGRSAHSHTSACPVSSSAPVPCAVLTIGPRTTPTTRSAIAVIDRDAGRQRGRAWRREREPRRQHGGDRGGPGPPAEHQQPTGDRPPDPRISDQLIEAGGDHDPERDQDRDGQGLEEGCVKPARENR